MSPATITLDTESQDVELLVAWAKAIEADLGEPIGMVVIDTLNRAMGGGNENSAEDMGAFLAAAAKLQKALGCLVLIVHHSGKDEAKGSRGHSSLLGAVDTELEVRREPQQPGNLKVTKQRDGDDGRRFGFGLQVVTIGEDEDGDQVTSCVITVEAEQEPIKPLKGNQAKAWKALGQALDVGGEPSPGTTGTPSQGTVTREELAKKNFASQFDSGKPPINAWAQTIDRLVELGAIGRSSPYIWKASDRFRA